MNERVLIRGEGYKRVTVDCEICGSHYRVVVPIDMELGCCCPAAAALTFKEQLSIEIKLK